MIKKLVVRNRKPTHPGAILREDVLPSLNITESELAVRLGFHLILYFTNST